MSPEMVQCQRPWFEATKLVRKKNERPASTEPSRGTNVRTPTVWVIPLDRASWDHIEVRVVEPLPNFVIEGCRIPARDPIRAM